MEAKWDASCLPAFILQPNQPFFQTRPCNKKPHLEKIMNNYARKTGVKRYIFCIFKENSHVVFEKFSWDKSIYVLTKTNRSQDKNKIR